MRRRRRPLCGSLTFSHFLFFSLSLFSDDVQDYEYEEQGPGQRTGQGIKVSQNTFPNTSGDTSFGHKSERQGRGTTRPSPTAATHDVTLRSQVLRTEYDATKSRRRQNEVRRDYVRDSKERADATTRAIGTQGGRRTTRIDDSSGRRTGKKKCPRTLVWTLPGTLLKKEGNAVEQLQEAADVVLQQDALADVQFLGR